MSKVRISVWSDYVCPFCYLEEPVLQRLRQEHGEDLEVAWRAFELRPEPAPTLDPDGEYLHRVWNASVYPMARERGMTLHLPPVQPRSRKAMELAEFAREKGKFDAVHEALFRAFFEHGRDLSDAAVLVGIGAANGLDPGEVHTALQAGRYSGRVIEDQREAAALGVQGVPAMVVHRADETAARGQAISGAASYDTVNTLVEQALGKARER
jgi:predicted DsbA family dithiol-disulfide isomerase